MHENSHVNTYLTSLTRGVRQTLTRLAEFGVGQEEALSLVTRAVADGGVGHIEVVEQAPESALQEEALESALQTVFTVRLDDGLWLMEMQPANPEAVTVRDLYDRKEDAITAAIEGRIDLIAESSLIITNEDGSVETYGPGEGIEAS